MKHKLFILLLFYFCSLSATAQPSIGFKGGLVNAHHEFAVDDDDLVWLGVEKKSLKQKGFYLATVFYTKFTKHVYFEFSPGITKKENDIVFEYEGDFGFGISNIRITRVDLPLTLGFRYPFWNDKFGVGMNVGIRGKKLVAAYYFHNFNGVEERDKINFSDFKLFEHWESMLACGTRLDYRINRSQVLLMLDFLRDKGEFLDREVVYREIQLGLGYLIEF